MKNEKRIEVTVGTLILSLFLYGLGRIRKGNWYKRNEITLVPPTSFLLYKDKQIKESDFYLYMNKENKKVKNSRRGMRPPTLLLFKWTF